MFGAAREHCFRIFGARLLAERTRRFSGRQRRAADFDQVGPSLIAEGVAIGIALKSVGEVVDVAKRAAQKQFSRWTANYR
jgi:hypothetical protein